MVIRIFLAINLPDDLKDRLESELKDISPKFDFPIRFLSRDHWHITVSFLGYQVPESLAAISSSAKKTASGFWPPKINFTCLTYGPLKDGSEARPVRMIWLNGSAETTRVISPVKKSLEEELYDQGVKFRQEARSFQTHITLARFEPVSIDRLTPIKKEFSYEFQAKSLDIMQSRLKRSGAEYELLSSFAFGKEV